MRLTITLVTVLIGLALAITGFVLAPPIGETTSPVISNPVMPFAAGMWTIGIIVLFLSPVVYNLVKDKEA